MHRPIILILFNTCFLFTVSGQVLNYDEYCIKFEQASMEKYFPSFDDALLDNQMLENSRLLSMFGEAPLINNDNDVFRSITFGSFGNLYDIDVFLLEKKESTVGLTYKFLQRKKSSYIHVIERELDQSVWKDFEGLIDSLFLNQPMLKKDISGIHDGSTDVYEGKIDGIYHYLQRHVMSATDPDLYLIRKFLYGQLEYFYGINCKKNLRER